MLQNWLPMFCQRLATDCVAGRRARVFPGDPAITRRSSVPPRPDRTAKWKPKFAKTWQARSRGGSKGYHAIEGEMHCGGGTGSRIMKSTKENLARMDRLVHESIHDPYKTRSKPHEPTVCPDCKAVFSNGRWNWMESPPPDSRPAVCPACQRTKDQYPAGVVTLKGAFAREHRKELLDLVHHQEDAEKTRHPLHRLMSIEENPEGIVINTTDIHLPRRISNALYHAYKGSLEIQYDDEDYFVRISWTREQ